MVARWEALRRIGALPVATITPEAARRLGDACLAVADQAAEAEDAETAAKSLGLAEQAARLSKDAEYSKTTQARVAEERRAIGALARLRPLVERLKANPADREANLAVGRHRCLVRGDWEGGLAMLAAGASGELKAAADKDVAAGAVDSADATVALAVGHTWWGVADLPATAVADRAPIRARAAVWYTRALPKLDGLAKVLAEKRIGEAGKAMAAAGAGRPGAVKPVELIVEAYIDGNTTLHVTPAGIYWRSHGAAKPGKHDGRDEATYVNGQAWKPKWGQAGDRGDDQSDGYRLALGSVRDLEVEVVACGREKGGTGIEQRDPVTGVTAGEEYVVTIKDGQSGARWYRLRVGRKQ